MQAAPSVSTPPAARSVLAFDTSTEALCIGLQAGAGRFCAELPGGAAASAQLLPQLQGLLRQAGIGWGDVRAIAFGAGPGAFTGLRTSCAVAQGLGLGLGLPLLPLDSLLIVAEAARGQAEADHTDPAAQLSARAGPWDVLVAMDARMEEAYAGCYRWHDGAWQTLQAPALYSLAALPQAWAGQRPLATAGTAVAAFGSRVAWPAPPAPTGTAHRADALLRLAVAAAQRGEGIEPDQALPLYLRDKVAQTSAERAAGRAVAAGPA